jgi:hypothetical protein
MAQDLEFRRIVLGLSYNRLNNGMRLAAEMAHLLKLDLFGFFVEDDCLRGLAALPFVREFQLLGGGWRPLDIDRLSRDLEMAAKNAERAFTEAAKTLRTTCQFEVVRGSMADTIASISRAGDIVLIAEPLNAAERIIPQFIATLDAAFHSAAAVLLVPRQIARQSGAIVAIATEPDDLSIEIAKAVASAAKEELVVIESFESAVSSHTPAKYSASRIHVRRIVAAEHELANTSNIGSALGQVRERLIVITRSDDYSPLAIATMRHVPILIVEPVRDTVESKQRTRPAS